MKKYSLIFILILLMSTLVSSGQAQDTVTVEVNQDVKLQIYSKNREALKQLKQVDINDIIRKVIEDLPSEDNAPQSKEKVYEYEITNESGTLVVVRQLDFEQDSARIARYEARKYRRNRRFWAIDVGLNNYIENGKIPDSQGAAYGLNPTGSRYFAIGMYNRTRLGGRKSPVSLQAGLEVSWYNFTFQGNNYITSTATGVEFRDYQSDFGEGLRKSKLVVPYLNIPVTLNFRFRNSEGKRTFNFGLGGYAGYRLNSYSKAKIDRDPNRNFNSFYLNSWRYGLEVQGGYRGFLMFFKYDLNPLFDLSRGPELNAFTFGIRL